MPKWLDIKVEAGDRSPAPKRRKGGPPPQPAGTQPVAGSVEKAGRRLGIIVSWLALVFMLALIVGLVWWSQSRKGAAPAPLPEVVATVNGEAITREQLDKISRVNLAMYPLAQGREMNTEPFAWRQFQSQLLDQLIGNVILIQEANKANLEVSEADVDSELQGLAASYKVSVADIDNRLNQVGLQREALRDWLRGALRANRLLAGRAAEANARGETFSVEAWLNELQVKSQVETFLPPDPGTQLARVGNVAPDFALSEPEGRTWRLSELRGKPVVINFWATWCNPCRLEMPLLERAYQRHKEHDLVILAVDIKADRGPEAVKSYRQELGLTFPLILDTTGQVENTYKVRGYPTTILVDRNGIVVDVKRGAVPTQEALEQLLAKIVPATRGAP